MNAIYSDYSPIFLYVDKYRFSKNWGYPGSTVPYSLIRYVISGRAVFSLGDTSYDVGPDDVFYIPQGSVLSCAAKEEIAFISIRFVGSVQLADTDMLCALWNVPFLHNFSDMPEMWTYFKYLEIRGYLNLICAQLARVSLDNFDKDETLEEDRKKMEARFDIESIRRRAVKSATQKNDPRITIILDTIISHLEKNYTTKELCDMAEISESTLRRLFKEQAGKTLYEL